MSIEQFQPTLRTACMVSPPSWKFIASLVAMKHGVSLSAILGRSRQAPVAAARQEAMALVYSHTRVSLTTVGRFFGRNHTTVLYACQRVGIHGKLVEKPQVETLTPAERKKARYRANVGRVVHVKPRTALQRAILRAYENGIPASVVASEYGCAVGSVKVIAHRLRAEGQALEAIGQ